MISRKLFILALIFIGITTSLTAQSEKKQSFSISYYPFTMYTITSAIYGDNSPYMHNNDNFGKRFEAVMGGYGYKAVGYNNHYYGAWELAYKRTLNKSLQFNLGLGCEFSSKQWDLYDIPDGPREKRIMDYRITLLPGI